MGNAGSASASRLTLMSGNAVKGAAELALVIDELRFQLADMAREIDRNEAGIRIALGDVEQIGFEEWRLILRNTLPKL